MHSAAERQSAQKYFDLLRVRAPGIESVVAGLSGAPIAAILIFLAAYRMLQDYVVSPHLMGHGVELHPLLVLFGVFAGAEVAGIAGTFLSVPVLALARIVYMHIRKARISAGVAVRP